MMRTGDVGEIDTRGVGWSGWRAPVTECYDLAVVCHQQARVCPVNGARCDQVACIDVGCTAENANLDTERRA
jgi:hypothetical protein